MKTLRNRVGEVRSIILPDSQLVYALHSTYASGNSDKAFELIVAVLDSWQGSLMSYAPTVKLLGAENRKGVTCYLDSILFAMFARLDSFETMLQKRFRDDARNRLCLTVRLWVNLLRSGKSITIDITQLLQESLAECGWKEAGELKQQDASEAFTFITEQLELPLLTLKMDIYHTGREDAADDHKFIKERLLEVAIPSNTSSNRDEPIPLEDCLEAYFNNRIEVKRYLGRRPEHAPSPSTDLFPPISEKSSSMHVESLDEEFPPPNSPAQSTTASRTTRPLSERTPSIVQQRFIPDVPSLNAPPAYEAVEQCQPSRMRSGSIRKEVLMPAWQFFSLIRK